MGILLLLEYAILLYIPVDARFLGENSMSLLIKLKTGFYEIIQGYGLMTTKTIFATNFLFITQNNLTYVCRTTMLPNIFHLCNDLSSL